MTPLQKAARDEAITEEAEFYDRNGINSWEDKVAQDRPSAGITEFRERVSRLYAAIAQAKEISK